MQTKLTDQIKAVQALRKHLRGQIGVINGMTLSEIDLALNDAGATLTALKATSAVVHSFGKDETTKAETIETAANFFIELNALEYGQAKTNTRQ